MVEHVPPSSGAPEENDRFASVLDDAFIDSSRSSMTRSSMTAVIKDVDDAANAHDTPRSKTPRHFHDLVTRARALSPSRDVGESYSDEDGEGPDEDDEDSDEEYAVGSKDWQKTFWDQFWPKIMGYASGMIAML